MAIDAHWTSAAILELPFLCFLDDFFDTYNSNNDLGFEHIHLKMRFVVQGVFMQDDEAGAGKYIFAISFSRKDLMVIASCISLHRVMTHYRSPRY